MVEILGNVLCSLSGCWRRRIAGSVRGRVGQAPTWETRLLRAVGRRLAQEQGITGIIAATPRSFFFLIGFPTV